MSIEKMGAPTEYESNPAFKEQFNKRIQVELAGGTAEVVDIRPEHAKSEVPVMLAPAWGCTLPVYEPALEVLSKTNRRVISLDHPRHGGNMDEVAEKFGVDIHDAIEKYPKEELRKALNLLGVLDELGIEKTDIIAHSEGAVNSIIAAVLDPEKFRNIVLYAPAGLIGEDSIGRLLKGFLGQRGGRPETFKDWPVGEIEKYTSDVAAKEVINYVAEKGNRIQSLVRSAGEVKGIMESQIHPYLAYLREKGIKIVVITGVDDPVFPIDRMTNNKGTGIVKADMLDGFLSVRGGHGEIGGNPNEFMWLAEDMISKMEAKTEKEAKEIDNS